MFLRPAVLALLPALSACGAHAFGAQSEFISIVPKPHSLERREGNFRVDAR